VHTAIAKSVHYSGFAKPAQLSSMCSALCMAQRSVALCAPPPATSAEQALIAVSSLLVGQCSALCLALCALRAVGLSMM
jgi:hypothetical protein